MWDMFEKALTERIEQDHNTFQKLIQKFEEEIKGAFQVSFNIS